MQINAELISYLETLSCLTLAEHEKSRLSADLRDILSGMARLGELDTGDVPERSHPFDYTNAFREDESGASLDRALILKNAPERDGEMFAAPKTVE